MHAANDASQQTLRAEPFRRVGRHARRRIPDTPRSASDEGHFPPLSSSSRWHAAHPCPGQPDGMRRTANATTARAATEINTNRHTRPRKPMAQVGFMETSLIRIAPGDEGQRSGTRVRFSI